MAIFSIYEKKPNIIYYPDIKSTIYLSSYLSIQRIVALFTHSKTWTQPYKIKLDLKGLNQCEFLWRRGVSSKAMFVNLNSVKITHHQTIVLPNLVFYRIDYYIHQIVFSKPYKYQNVLFSREELIEIWRLVKFSRKIVLQNQAKALS